MSTFHVTEYCHDLEVMSSNPGQVELGVYSTSAPSRTLTKKKKKRTNGSGLEDAIVWLKFDLGQKYHSPTFRPKWGSNS